MWQQIDWTNPAAKVTEHFCVKDCLWLPSWGRLANESDGLNDQIKQNLYNLCLKMEVIRAFCGGLPINVHVMLRPITYNAIIPGAALHSAHIEGLACDFDVQTRDCDLIRQKLLPMLEQWSIRMEKRPGENWVHIDMRPVATGGTRYFLP